MKVGILFRREVNLTYARIQDIHLRSGLIQRWLRLANVQIQTASGSSGPELEAIVNTEIASSLHGNLHCFDCRVPRLGERARHRLGHAFLVDAPAAQ